MVLLISSLPTIILIVFILFLFLNFTGKKDIVTKWKRAGYGLVIWGLVMLVYSATLPSYQPKGVVQRTELPEFEVKGEIRNLQPQPMSGAERDRRRKEAYLEPLPFTKEKE